MTHPPRIPIAHTPTPLETLRAASARLGVNLRVKRDDLTGSHLSGNKIRKLEYLLADAMSEGATHVITCGGVQSNHCRATALAAAPLGLTPVVLLRTSAGQNEDLPDPPTGNVLLDLLAGATIHTCDAAGYMERDARMEALAHELRSAGEVPYIIPEGGSNALGSMGYVRATLEMSAQWGETPPSSIIVATGSGGTLAGVAMGIKHLGLPTRVLGMAVCDDAETFQAKVLTIAESARQRFETPALGEADFRVIDAFKGIGYAVSRPEELALLRDVARIDGLILDPVYTAKAWLGLERLCHDEPELTGPHPIFVHTGGIFGLMPSGDAFGSLLRGKSAH